MNATKLIFIDIEATGDGTNPRHTILSISAIVTIKGVIADTITIDMQPKHNALIAYHKKLYEKHSNNKDLPTQTEGFKRFIKFLDKFISRYDSTDKLIAIAFNARFDEKHLVNWFKENSHNYLSSYIIPPFICVQQLSTLAIPHIIPYLKKRTLRAIATVLNIDVEYDKLHTSMYDAKLCMNVYYSLVPHLKKTVNEI